MVNRIPHPGAYFIETGGNVYSLITIHAVGFPTMALLIARVPTSPGISVIVRTFDY
jgi:hypothetical protein